MPLLNPPTSTGSGRPGSRRPRLSATAAARLAAALAALVALTFSPAQAAGQEQADTTTPRYMERIEESRRLDRGVAATREELEALPARTVGQAIDRLVRVRFRTEAGRPCAPAVYWNGMAMDERWHPSRSLAAGTLLDRVQAIEIFFADRKGGLPPEYLRHDCGVIALWVRNVPDDESAMSTLSRLTLVVAAGLVFFLLVVD